MIEQAKEKKSIFLRFMQKKLLTTAKKHNNANVIVFGGRTMKTQDVIRRINIFNQTEFEGGRHIRRIEKIEEGK